jgi:hypothetical protein
MQPADSVIAPLLSALSARPFTRKTGGRCPIKNRKVFRFPATNAVSAVDSFPHFLFCHSLFVLPKFNSLSSLFMTKDLHQNMKLKL